MNLRFEEDPQPQPDIADATDQLRHTIVDQMHKAAEAQINLHAALADAQRRSANEIRIDLRTLQLAQRRTADEIIAKLSRTDQALQELKANQKPRTILGRALHRLIYGGKS